MRRHTVPERLQKEAELAVRLLFGESQHLEHFLLDIVLMDSDAAASDLASVQDDIISLRADRTRIRIQQRDILVHRHRKRMMHCRISVFLLRPLQQRELSDPHKTIFVFVDQIHLFRQLQTKRTQNVPYHPGFIGREQQQISRLSVHCLNQLFHLVFRHEFCKRGFASAVLLNRNIRQAFGAVAFGKLHKLVDFLAGHAALSLRVDSAHRTACFQCVSENRKLRITNHIGYVFQLHSETEIRLVRTEPVHRLLPGHSLDRKGHLNAEKFMEQVCQQTLVDVNDILNVHKRKLHVDLRKFRLTVCTEVLIAEAPRNLHISVIAGAHQQLFKQLRRLRQRIKAAGMNTAGHQIISGSLRRGFCQHRSFDFQKSFLVQKLAGQHRHFRAQDQISLKIRAAKIQGTVFQTHFLPGL